MTNILPITTSILSLGISLVLLVTDNNDPITRTALTRLRVPLHRTERIHRTFSKPSATFIAITTAAFLIIRFPAIYRMIGCASLVIQVACWTQKHRLFQSHARNQIAALKKEITDLKATITDLNSRIAGQTAGFDAELNNYNITISKCSALIKRLGGNPADIEAEPIETKGKSRLSGLGSSVVALITKKEPTPESES